jgi:hypothetical protein
VAVGLVAASKRDGGRRVLTRIGYAARRVNLECELTPRCDLDNFR